MSNLKSLLKTTIRSVVVPARNMLAQVQSQTPRPPRFTGAFKSYDEAVANTRKSSLIGYDNDEIVTVSQEAMTKIASWDYPVLFWLERLIKPETHIVDAGGHVGTKFLAFRRLLDLTQVRWTVYDLPALVRAGKEMLTKDATIKGLGFSDKLGTVERVDILLASGLMQYLDKSFAQLISELPNKPDKIIINKVATRDGETLVTLEQIGSAQVAYQIRNREALEQSFGEAGYEILDDWVIPDLAHRIATHQHFGPSTSRGYVLGRNMG